jgi:hypothetical protein
MQRFTLFVVETVVLFAIHDDEVYDCALGQIGRLIEHDPAVLHLGFEGGHVRSLTAEPAAWAKLAPEHGEVAASVVVFRRFDGEVKSASCKSPRTRCIIQSVTPSKLPSTARERVAIFAGFFRGREDVWAKMWVNARKGTRGNAPARRGGAFLPLRRQKLRFSTATTPRVISCAEDHGDRMALPRGCLTELETLLLASGAAIQLRDEREPGTLLEVAFRGELLELQRQGSVDTHCR